jgi:hypothetical protein
MIAFWSLDSDAIGIINYCLNSFRNIKLNIFVGDSDFENLIDHYSDILKLIK